MALTSNVRHILVISPTATSRRCCAKPKIMRARTTRYAALAAIATAVRYTRSNRVNCGRLNPVVLPAPPDRGPRFVRVRDRDNRPPYRPHGAGIKNAPSVTAVRDDASTSALSSVSCCPRARLITAVGVCVDTILH